MDLIVSVPELTYLICKTYNNTRCNDLVWILRLFFFKQFEILKFLYFKFDLT